MNETLLTILIWFPVLLAISATLIAWRTIEQRMLFFVAGSFLLLGVQSVVSPAAIGIFMLPDSNISAAAALKAFSHSVVASAVIVGTVGSALLWWLYSALRQAKKSHGLIKQ